jgi:GLPGLI family protein
MKQILIIILTLSALPSSAQPKFVSTGKIEYERRTNQHTMLEDESMFDGMMKEMMPQFAITYYDLYFTEGKTLYKEGREPENKKIHWSITYLTNTVYRELDNGTRTTQRNLFGSSYLVQDSALKINWKITNEPRTIAGFECRKAVARIFDSVVVIAFYTDEILPSAGPESFGGLPGMILGLAIPRLHTTWYATKLELVDVTKQLSPPTEGTRYTGEQYQKQVKTFMERNEWLKKISWQMVL